MKQKMQFQISQKPSFDRGIYLVFLLVQCSQLCVKKTGARITDFINNLFSYLHLFLPTREQLSDPTFFSIVRYFWQHLQIMSFLPVASHHFHRTIVPFSNLDLLQEVSLPGICFTKYKLCPI